LKNDIEQLRAEMQSYQLRVVAAWVIGAACFLALLLPNTELFNAAKFLSMGVFVLCWIYALIVWFFGYGARRRLRDALRAPNQSFKPMPSARLNSGVRPQENCHEADMDNHRRRGRPSQLRLVSIALRLASH
jgi:hypothetical protein